MNLSCTGKYSILVYCNQWILSALLSHHLARLTRLKPKLVLGCDVIEINENIAEKSNRGKTMSSLGIFFSKLVGERRLYMKKKILSSVYHPSSLISTFLHTYVLITLSIPHRRKRKKNPALFLNKRSLSKKTSSFLRLGSQHSTGVLLSFLYLLCFPLTIYTAMHL